MKIGGAGHVGRDNGIECWCVVSKGGRWQAAKFRWIFTKAIRLNGTTFGIVQKTFMHVSSLKEVSLDMLGRRHPGPGLIAVTGIRLAMDNNSDYGEEIVIDS